MDWQRLGHVSRHFGENPKDKQIEMLLPDLPTCDLCATKWKKLFLRDTLPRSEAGPGDVAVPGQGHTRPGPGPLLIPHPPLGRHSV